MTKIIRDFIFCIFFLLSIESPAETEGYICKIIEIQELNKSGRFIQYEGLYKQFIGTSFSIDRTSGKVIGFPFSNESYKEIRVLSRGSKENSFKQIAVSHPPNIWIQYLYVAEYEEGPKKPFWGTTDGDYIYSGNCQ